MITVGPSQQTAATILLRQHYREMGIDRGWSVDRMKQLCNQMQILPVELGALIAMPRNYFGECVRVGRFAPWVGLHFHIIQDWYLYRTSGVPFVPRIPVDYVMH